MKIVRHAANSQSTEECRENYLNSCEESGGDLAEIAKIIRNEFQFTYYI